MKNLAPDIFRQRLIIEGIYIEKPTVFSLKRLMQSLSKKLGMKIIYGPLVHDLAGNLNPLHKGFECNLIWAESGASVYTWDRNSFFSVDIYTCKKFDSKVAVKHVKTFFKAKEIQFKEV